MSRHEGVYDREYVEDIEDQLERREKIALNLADQLNAKIDECEALKSEVARLNDMITSIMFESQ